MRFRDLFAINIYAQAIKDDELHFLTINKIQAKCKVYDRWRQAWPKYYFIR